MIFIELGRPHLVLPHFRGNDGFALRDFIHALDDLLRLQHIALGPGKRMLLLPFQHLPHPVRMIARPVLLGMTGLQNGTQPLQGTECIAHNRHFHPDILSQSRRVDVDVHDSRVGSELGQFSRDAVIKTGSNSQNDVSLSHGAVCREGPMHTEHTYPQRIITGESPQPHQRGTDRSVHEVGQCAEFLCGIGHDHATTSHDKRFSGGNEDVHRPPKLVQIGPERGAV